MKKMLTIAALSIIMGLSAASADNTAFVKELTKSAMTASKPSTLTQLENLWNPAASYETKAKMHLLEATGKKAEAEKHFATIAELEGKDKLKGKEKKSLASANESVNALIADANTLEEGKEAEVGKAFGYISLAVKNYTLITAGSKDVVNNVKSKGKSPAVIGQTKKASSIASAAPARLSGSKELLNTIMNLMKTNNIAIPSADKATEGVER